MTEDSPVADILESVLRLYPDRFGGSLSIKETADYLHKVHGIGKGTGKSKTEVIRRNLPNLGIKVSDLPGLGKRIWVSALVEAMGKLRDPALVMPKVAKAKSGFGDKRLDYANKTGPGANKGGVTPSTVGFITKGDILVANPDGWRWRPQRQIPVVPRRTQFVSELAAVRYKKAQQRSQDFWNGVWLELRKLLAGHRQATTKPFEGREKRARPIKRS